MERRGRKRRFNPNIPRHIDQSKLPCNCYWQKSTEETGFWYGFIKEGEKKRKKRLAGSEAKLSELHRLVEALQETDDTLTFRWLAKQYFKTPDYKGVSKKTKDSYQYGYETICAFDTKMPGIKLADTDFVAWDTPMLQRIVDSMYQTPTKAKHMHTFARLVFNSAIRRGYCKTNPCIGVKLPEERKKRTLPTQRAYDRLLQRAKDRGTYGQKTSGSCPHYLWPIMEILYLCYLRGVEARNMTDAHVRDDVIIANRRKGSGSNEIRLNARLSRAISFLQESRSAIFERKRLIIPIRPEDRLLVVSTLGEKVSYSAYQNAWNRFIRLAIKDGVIDDSERFSLHDLKRKGVTDSNEENPAEHQDSRMKEVYDLSVRTIDPAAD